MKHRDRCAVKYALPNYEELLKDSDGLSIRRELSRCQLFVEYRGDGLWCVTDGVQNYARNGEPSYEPTPSSRDEKFLAEYRFTRDEAFEIAVRALGAYCTSVLWYSRATSEKLRDAGKPEAAEFHDRLQELIEDGIAAAKRDFAS